MKTLTFAILTLLAAASASAQQDTIAIRGRDSTTFFYTGDATNTSFRVTPYKQWFSCLVEAVTATTICKAAPAAGLRNYVTSVSCSNEAATVQSIDVISGTGAACGTGTTALTHKIQFGTAATTTSPFISNATFEDPLVPTVLHAICLRPSAATAFGCTLTGFTAP